MSLNDYLDAVQGVDDMREKMFKLKAEAEKHAKSYFDSIGITKGTKVLYNKFGEWLPAIFECIRQSYSLESDPIIFVMSKMTKAGKAHKTWTYSTGNYSYIKKMD